MATVHGTVEQPLEEASNSTRAVAASQGYSLAEGQGEPNVLVFKKGASAFSWGSQLTVYRRLRPRRPPLRSRGNRHGHHRFGPGQEGATGCSTPLGAAPWRTTGLATLVS